MKYACIEENAQRFSKAAMFQILGVSSSGYYDWRRREKSQRARTQEVLDTVVRQAFMDGKGREGAPRLTCRLSTLGHKHDEKTIAASLKRQGLRAKAARKFKATTDSDHKQPVAQNLLNRDFNPPQPNLAWAGDITVLWTDEGWLYLAVIIDLHSRKVIGWSMSRRMKADLVCNALLMALFRRGFPRGVLVHSDRGSQYCSRKYQRLLKGNHLICSMSRRGNCWDNAVVESFFHTMKIECIHSEHLPTREYARQVIFQYIEADYNVTRLHSTLGYQSPNDFEAAYAA